jgi:hypothetical protein
VEAWLLGQVMCASQGCRRGSQTNLPFLQCVFKTFALSFGASISTTVKWVWKMDALAWGVGQKLCSVCCILQLFLGQGRGGRSPGPCFCSAIIYSSCDLFIIKVLLSLQLDFYSKLLRSRFKFLMTFEFNRSKKSSPPDILLSTSSLTILSSHQLSSQTPPCLHDPHPINHSSTCPFYLWVAFGFIPNFTSTY